MTHLNIVISYFVSKTTSPNDQVMPYGSNSRIQTFKLIGRIVDTSIAIISNIG